MLVSEEQIKKLEKELTDDEIKKAQKYVNNNLVDLEDISVGYYDYSMTISVRVNGVMVYIYLSLEKLKLTEVRCRYHWKKCEHELAALLKLNQDLEFEQRVRNVRNAIIEKREKEKFEKMLQAFNKFDNTTEENFNKIQIYNKEINIIPVLKKDSDTYEVSFKIGNKKMYKIKSISGFYNSYIKGSVYYYGSNLVFKHTKDAFCDNAIPYIDWLLKYGKMRQYYGEYLQSEGYNYYGRPITLPDGKIILNKENLEDFINCIKNSNHEIEIEKEKIVLEIQNKEPDIKFDITNIENKKYALKCNKNNLEILEGYSTSYIIDKNKLYAFNTKDYENSIKLMRMIEDEGIDKYTFGDKGLIDFVNIVLPKIKNNVNITNLSEEDKEKYIPKKLAVKIKLDLDEDNEITANVEMCYGNIEFNPMEESPQIPRDIQAEKNVATRLTEDGFRFNELKNTMVLLDEDDIYEFLSNKINGYMEDYEVLVTERFKTKQVRQPKIQTLGVKIQNDLLSIDLTGINYDPKELKDIMEKYKLKKKYYKLKDGSFLSLEKNENMDFLENLTEGLEIDVKDLAKGQVKLPINRSLYLNKLMENIPNTQINQNSEYKNLIEETQTGIKDEEIQVPPELSETLRTYQKTGYRWLRVLDKYRFGGILADDMGLGKTLQVIAILLQSKNEKNTSIVVAPSSLTLNWQNEIQKFSNNLSTIVINGNQAEREKKIKNIPNYDVAITSYDLLKRDVETYKTANINFRYIIADEAQYIKNSNTQNARALKDLNGQTRFALTGTPIENSLSELWSIFDYIMPGYLFTYTKFKKDFETKIVKDNNQETMQRLKKLIEPFVLRRVKEQVLTELPEKTITILDNEMESEQEKIYLSYLAKAKKEMLEAINTEGFEKSQIKILSLLTRLRQICCHPSLFLTDYQGGSSKLNQCMELITDAISSNHKILLFSTYTQMFEIIEDELQYRDIKYYKLTGSTKVDERIEMVDNFNKNDEIKVFLISLKAGGTGLNLTGADVVIHYDPWWNVSAENQATDRAYRIGQKNNVQVYKLITKNSIEEKIQELQKKKAQMIDNVLDTKETFINKLSKEDIMDLFK